MSAQEFRLPDVGEGLTEAEIVKWHVAVGDTVALNDVLVEIETAKSVVELPSPFAGTVVALLAEEGQTVAVGSAVVTIGDAPADPEPEAETKPEAGAETKPAVLVGYGPSDAGRTSRRRPAPAAGATAPPGKPTAALAKPPVRKLAKDLGVDITALTPSGPGGTVTREDIRRHADADRVQGAPAGRWW